MSILETKEIKINGLIILAELVADYQSGFTQFNDKWTRDQDGLIISDDGSKWSNNWVNVGQLNKGNDITKYQAQKEFDRDCNAFDVFINAKVIKNDIELIDQVIISGDYSWDDDQTTLEVLDYLISDYLDTDYLISEAKTILKQLSE